MDLSHVLTEDIVGKTSIAPRLPMDPFESTSPTQMLSRSVLVSTGTLTSNASVELSVVSIMYTSPIISKLIKTFGWFRFDAIEITIAFNYPVEAGGFLLINSWPNSAFAPSNTPTLSKLTGPATALDPFMICAGMNQVYKRSFPWMIPYSCDSTQNDIVMYLSSTMWIVRMTASELVKNISTGPTPTITYNMWGRFINPQAMVPAMELQSGSVFASMDRRDTIGMATSAVGIGATYAWEYAKKRATDYTSKAVEQGTEAGVNWASDKMREYLPGERDDPEENEAEIDTGGPIRQDMRPDVWGDTSSCSRFAVRNLRRLDPSAGVRAVPDYPTKGNWTVRELIARPSAMAQFRFTTLGDLWKLPHFVGNFSWGQAGYPVVYYDRWVDYFSQFFRFWRGSVKWCFFFVLPAMQSARVRLSLQRPSSGGVIFPNIHSESLLCKEVTVEGCVEVSFTIPYLEVVPWRTCSPANYQGYTYPLNNGHQSLVLVIELISALRTTGDVAPVMQCYGWSSAGEDFEFDGFCPQIPYSDGYVPEPDMQSSILDCFAKPFEGFMGKSMAQHRPSCSDMTVLDIASRYSNRYDGTDTLHFSEVVSPGGLLSYSGLSLYDAIGYLFLYYSGPIAVKVNISDDPSTEGYFSAPPSLDPSLATFASPLASGLSMYNAAFFPTTEFEAPFIFSCDWTYFDVLKSPLSSQMESGRTFFSLDPTALEIGSVMVAATNRTRFMVPMCVPRQLDWFTGDPIAITLAQPD